MEKTISIIITVFNSATSIEKCLHSLFNQTYHNLEYIFVDDGTEDESVNIIMKVLELYPKRKCQVKIFSHKSNKGVSQARITGILKATGDYIIHCNSDDFVEIEMYELLYNKALQTNADIILCNIKFVFENNTTQIKKFDFDGNSKKYLESGILTNFGYANMVNKLIKKIIFENKIYPFPNCN